MPCCQAFNCSNEKGKCRKSFHRFPNPNKSEQDREICKQWIVNLRNRRLKIETLNYKVKLVCEDHFTPDCFVKNNVAESLNFKPRRKHLYKHAIPTLVSTLPYKIRKSRKREPVASTSGRSDILSSKKAKEQVEDTGAQHSEMASNSSSTEMPPPPSPTKAAAIQEKSVEIEDSGSDSDDPIYKFNFDLEDLIASSLDEFGDPERNEESPTITKTINDLNGQLKGIEKKQKEIEKLFMNCSGKLKAYQQSLEEADREEVLKEAAAEFEAKEAAEANARNEATDSDDDDVQIISASFDPQVVAKNRDQQRMQVLKIPPNQGSSPSLANMRQALTGAITQSINKQNSTQNGQPAGNRNMYPVTSVQTNEAFLKEAMAIDVGSKVLGKKFNDIWYKGTVNEVIQDGDDVVKKKFTVKFDGKGKKTLSSLHCAFKDSLNKSVSVGTRVVALYKDEDSMASFYAGIVAETPNGRNQFRYLIFFDDGYAQYSRQEDIHKVLAQSANVWEDIHPDSQEFIKDYLKQYPERPMVRLHKGQTVKTEWNGKWWTAKVEEVDSSLAKMYFLADKRIEWIYRGSTRLEPLFTALSNANKSTGKLRRTNAPSNKKHVVEYTRGTSEEGNKNKYQAIHPKPTMPTTPQEPILISSPPSQAPSTPETQTAKADGKKRSVARKSTTGANQNTNNTPPTTKWEAPWLKYQKRQQTTAPSSTTPNSDTTPTSSIDSKKSREMFSASSISSNKTGTDMASVLQERLSKVMDHEDIPDEEALGERLESVLPMKDRVRKNYVRHKCGPHCLQDTDDDPEKYRGTNPLLIPLLCGWERHVCKMKPSYKRHVMYRAPCARRLRTIEEVDYYLKITNSNLTIDLFCEDPMLHVHTEFVPVRTFCDIKDLSYGKENVPISCVNAIDRSYPDYVEYSNVRIPTKGVKLNLDPEFLIGCDCTDNCRDKSKCSCQQMTIDASTIAGGKLNKTAGYTHRRLLDPLITGIYECNSTCNCDCRCVNRVAQNPLSVRLQVFKTEKRGWGLRCLDDVPTGGFLCIYAGQLLTEQGANEDGQQYGDEYLAELDYMEVIENQKEGYESDVENDEGIGKESEDEEEESEDERQSSDSDSDYEEKSNHTNSALGENPHHTRTRTKRQEGSTDSDSHSKKDVGCKLVLRRDSSRSNDHEEWSVKLPQLKKPPDTASDPDVILINDDDDDEEEEDDSKRDDSRISPTTGLVKSDSVESPADSDSLPDLDGDTVSTQQEAKTKVKQDKPAAVTTEISADKMGNADSKPVQQTFTARRSTTGKMSRFKNLPDPKRKLGAGQAKKEEEKSEEDTAEVGTRSYFQDGQACYIMDAKSMGNIGRYLNHSCNPNVFVQNVFVDTHDLRFPWVAFFAGQYVRAGTELTWDYNYEVGSVPGKVLYCYCGSAECRGRLL